MKDPREVFGGVVIFSIVSVILTWFILVLPPSATAQQTARCVEKCEAIGATFERVDTRWGGRPPVTCSCSFEVPRDGGIP